MLSEEEKRMQEQNPAFSGFNVLKDSLRRNREHIHKNKHLEEQFLHSLDSIVLDEMEQALEQPLVFRSYLDPQDRQIKVKSEELTRDKCKELAANKIDFGALSAEMRSKSQLEEANSQGQ